MLKIYIYMLIFAFISGCSSATITSTQHECAGYLNNELINFNVIDYYDNNSFNEKYKWDYSGISLASVKEKYSPLSKMLSNGRLSVSFKVQSDSKNWAVTTLEIINYGKVLNKTFHGMILGLNEINDEMFLVVEGVKSKSFRFDHFIGEVVVPSHTPPLTNIKLSLVNVNGEIICSSTVANDLIYPKVEINIYHY